MSKKRKRVSRDQVKDNAKKGAGGDSWFALGDGSSSWHPEKAATYLVDVLPYEVKMESHPDDVPQGHLWYKLPFMVHHGVGVKNDSLVCPVSLGKRCPICEEADRLRKEDSDKYEDIIKNLRPQKFVAYNIVDPEDENKVCVFSFSRGKFAASLENELRLAENEEHLGFFDVTKDGRTLKVRWTDASFEGRKYLEATRIDFKERAEMDEDAVLDRVVCLEEALVIQPYDKLKDLFLQTTDDDEEEEKPETKEEAPPAEPEPEPTPEPEAKTEEPPAEPEAKAPDTMTCALCGDEFDTEDAVRSDLLDKDYCSMKCLKKAEKAAEADQPKGADPKEKKEEKKDTKTKGAKGKGKCPVDGGTFGTDLDKFDECDDCPIWADCEAANEGVNPSDGSRGRGDQPVSLPGAVLSPASSLRKDREWPKGNRLNK